MKKDKIKKIFQAVLPDIVSNELLYLRNKVLLKRKFLKIHSYKLKLKNPKTYSEKIQFRKYYGNYNFMSKIADKYLVREYVSKKLKSEENLIPLLGVYEKITLNDLKLLPDQFVIKTNHGSGKGHIEIVKNKKEKDLNLIIKKMNRAVKEKYGYSSNEMFYTEINSKIIVEELIGKSGKILNDYKFHIFKNNGEKKLFIQVDEGRYKDHRRSIFTENWELFDMKHNSKYKKIHNTQPPKNLDLMKEIAMKLAEEFDYIRVDLYNLDGKIYFGELTQTHGNGFEDIKPTEVDELWGSYWKLENKNTKLYRGDV